VDLRQMHTFGAPDRDPRGRSISVAYAGHTAYDAHSPRGGDDAADAAWFPVDALPALAFDHAEIIRHALQQEGKE
jgi:8-oxo-dGTP diphosphatase